MSLSWPFDFIKDLNDSKHFWKIAVRITQIWYVQTPPKPGHLEMILMNFKFTPGTTLKHREFPDIPELQYNFKKFSDILCGNFRSDLLIEVIGVFDTLVFTQTQSNLKKVIFNMKDFCGDVISCTLWEAHAIKNFNYYNNQPIVQPLIILLANAKVKEGQGNYSPTVSNTWCGSKLLIDEEIPNIQKYRDSINLLSIFDDVTKSLALQTFSATSRYPIKWNTPPSHLIARKSFDIWNLYTKVYQQPSSSILSQTEPWSILGKPQPLSPLSSPTIIVQKNYHTPP
ncbi:hypothetical protein Lal_00012664 [Lupinus albus]|nr:hypothetical protein Lal_00012664 [Lupinus albus]